MHVALAHRRRGVASSRSRSHVFEFARRARGCWPVGRMPQADGELPLLGQAYELKGLQGAERTGNLVIARCRLVAARVFGGVGASAVARQRPDGAARDGLRLRARGTIAPATSPRLCHAVASLGAGSSRGARRMSAASGGATCAGSYGSGGATPKSAAAPAGAAR